MRRKLLVLACLAFSSARGASSQTTPDLGIKGLDFLVGEWVSHETTKTDDGKEVPFTLRGKNTWTLDRTYLQIEESFEVEGMGKFANHILMNYNPATKKYGAWWFSSRSPRPLVFTGERADRSFVLTDERGRLRITYDLLAEGHYRARVEVKRDDRWETDTVAEYRRK